MYKKKQTGFIGITAMVIIAAALVVGGGVAYKVKKTPSNIETNIDSQNTVEGVNIDADIYARVPANAITDMDTSSSVAISNNSNLDVDEKPSTITTAPQEEEIPCNAGVKVLSPNGGDIFTVGQTVVVTWESCGYSNDSQVMIILRSTEEDRGAEIATVPNTGSAEIIIPKALYSGQIPLKSGKFYKIKLEINGTAMGGNYPKADLSDNLFTIQKETGHTYN
jgi:hypothetical protein